ncbi:MAG: hypothetical protein IKV21_02115 [Clostridia bacterium]|nr:hypothetical protein [Clostridia bacterium]
MDVIREKISEKWDQEVEIEIVPSIFKIKKFIDRKLIICGEEFDIKCPGISPTFIAEEFILNNVFN